MGFLFLVFIAGLAGGILASTGIFLFLRKRNSQQLSDALKETEARQEAALENLANKLKASLHESSLHALTQSTDSMLKLAGSQLGNEREMIAQELKHNKSHLGQHLETINTQIGKVSELMTSIEKDKSVQMARLSSLITTTQTQTADLLSVTSNLQAILSNSQARGQLGERIADDILRIAGYVENINYVKQRPMANGLRPDFTFLLPKGLVLNMDVKFPIQNYTRMIQASDKQEKDKFSRQFLADVKTSYKELAERRYMDPSQSVDCVLLFIPHEQIFSYIQQESPDIFDHGLQKNVVSCSPMTLFAVLAVVRKSIDHFTLEKTSHEILTQLNAFRKQWEAYCKSFDGLGKKINDLQGDYEKVAGTRTKVLDRQFEKIEKLQRPDFLTDV